tara:strand:+ start:137 stop:1105 length:969 start_codon:yes stop_codon:yes gene_type:complete
MTFQTIKDMPHMGFGLWKIAPDHCAEVVYEAVKSGYRHFDSACDYGNEKQVGEGLQRAMTEGLCSRQDLWVTSKLWNTYHHPDHVLPAMNRSLSDLQLDYLDLYLIHFPIALAYVPFETCYPPEWAHDPAAEIPVMHPVNVSLQETWHAMEQLKAFGRVKHIGVCNYSSGLLHDLMNYAIQPPEMLQIESHPYLTQERLIKLAQQYGMEVTAFSPLGAMSYFELDMADQHESVLEHSAIKTAASRTHKTAAQVVLRWGLQRGTSLVVKSVKTERMRENLSLDDFELTAAEMDAISGLNINRRFNDPGDFCEAAFGTFHPIYD